MLVLKILFTGSTSIRCDSGNVVYWEAGRASSGLTCSGSSASHSTCSRRSCSCWEWKQNKTKQNKMENIPGFRKGMVCFCIEAAKGKTYDCRKHPRNGCVPNCGLTCAETSRGNCCARCHPRGAWNTKGLRWPWWMSKSNEDLNLKGIYYIYFL